MPDAASLREAHERLVERVKQVNRTDAYSRPRWTLADVVAVSRLLEQVAGCLICRDEMEAESDA